MYMYIKIHNRIHTCKLQKIQYVSENIYIPLTILIWENLPKNPIWQWLMYKRIYMGLNGVSMLENSFFSRTSNSSDKFVISCLLYLS